MRQICRRESKDADWQDDTRADAKMNSDARKCSPDMAEILYCTADITQVTVSALP